jgi:hypothetical protein
VQFHQVLDERQADPQAALRAVQCLVALGKQVKDMRQKFRLNALPAVGHGNADALTLQRRRQRYLSLRAR